MQTSRRNFRKSPFVVDPGAAVALDEGALMEAFALRRRRMETVSRITEDMVLCIAAITDPGETSALVDFPDDVSLNSPIKTSKPHSPNDVQEGSKTAGDEGPNPLEMSSPNDAISQDTRHKLKKIIHMRAEQREAANIGMKPSFILEEDELSTHALPEKFSSASLGFILEGLAFSNMKIVTATDDIMLALSKMDKDTAPPTFKPMEVLAVQSRHAMKCYNLSLQHLKQYEDCEKALQEGSAQELSCMREQFLVRKEILTAQEQKQKVLEEQLQSLKLRVNNIDSCCRMWATSLLGVRSLSPPSSYSSPPFDRPCSSLQTEPVSLLRAPSMLRGSDRLNSSRASIAGSLYRAQSGGRTETLNTLLPPLSPSVSDDVELSSHGEIGGLDAMEVRVAQFWCNPYVKKAQRCAGWRRRQQQVTLNPEACRINAISPFLSSEQFAKPRPSLVRSIPEAKLSTRETGGKANTVYEPTGRPLTEVRLTGLLREILRSLATCMDIAGDSTVNDNTTTVGTREETCMQSSGPQGSDTVGSTTSQTEGSQIPTLIHEGSITSLRPAIGLEAPQLAELTESVNNLLRFLEMA